MNFLATDPIQLFSNLPSASNPFAAMLFIITHGGWILIIVTCIWGAWEGYKEYIRNRFSAQVEYALLAIDIPKMNEQSPKAIEHIFAHLYGIEKRGNLKERYLKGYTQHDISFEIVSIEGFIQFLVRTPVQFRDLVEAAIYAQYPDAEITEVEDYIDMIPRPLELPHPEWDIWGSQLKLIRPSMYPLRTYPFFEHSLTQKFMDPMASLLEIMSRMGPGEHLWIQLVVEPVNAGWRDKGLAMIRKLIGKKEPAKSGGDWGYFPREISKGLFESFTASILDPSDMGGAQNKKAEREWPSLMQHLSPDERSVVESIGMKISKLGFLTKIRFIYAARKEVMHKEKGVDAIVGAFQQFGTQDMNRLVVDKKTRTKIDYFFIKSRVLARKRRILWAYRYRSMKRGRVGFILNTEELATIWHFPVSEVVKAPMVQKVDAKKGQPPSDLPVQKAPPISHNIQSPVQKGSAPRDLPT
jgi:hypothetical protein